VQNEKLRGGAAEFAAFRVSRERCEHDARRAEQRRNCCKDEGVTRHRYS
jgi:hypothetical protein